MKKKFKYNLETILKLRKFREEEVKIRMGKILQEIRVTESRIKEIHVEIDQGYKEQDAALREDASGTFLHFFSNYLSGKKADIEKNENKLFSLKNQYQNVLEELNEARGDSKLLENMKEKKSTEHKKNNMKREQESLEELFLLKRVRS